MTNAAAVPSTSQLGEVAFISGVNPDGLTNAVNFWTWSRDNPATYTGTNSAHKWQGGSAGSGGTVIYYFDPNSNWTPEEKAGWRSGLALWSAVANVNFVETPFPSVASVTLYRNSDGAAFENDAYDPVGVGSPDIASSQKGAVVSIDTQAFGSVYDFSSNGGYGVGTVVHELGHLLGLGHGGPYDASHDSATQQYGPFDSLLWTIMSYIEPTDTNAKYFNQYPVTGTDWADARGPFTWMPLDILAAQRLYGKPVSTPLSGGQVFGFNCNITGPIKPYFDFTIDTKPVVTLWDAGSGNTLDLSGFNDPSIVNLNPGTFSSCGGLKNNLAIAFDTKIDKVVSGPGDDTIVVNDDGDTIDGGGGTNTVVFSGSSAQYAIADNAGTVLVTDSALGRNGTDLLSNVTFLQFTDRTIDARTLPGSATAQNELGGSGTDSVFRNSNPSPLLDWQTAGGGYAMPAAGSASNNQGTSDIPAQSGGSGLSLAAQMTNGAYTNALSAVGVTLGGNAA
jgi:hypothetical protein